MRRSTICGISGRAQIPSLTRRTTRRPRRSALNFATPGATALPIPASGALGGECSALFYPDVASNVREQRYLDYHWNGSRVDFYRDLDSGDVYRIA